MAEGFLTSTSLEFLLRFDTRKLSTTTLFWKSITDSTSTPELRLCCTIEIAWDLFWMYQTKAGIKGSLFCSSLSYVIFLITPTVPEYLLCCEFHAAGFSVVLIILEYEVCMCVSEGEGEKGNLCRGWNEEVESKARYPIGYRDRDTLAAIHSCPVPVTVKNYSQRFIYGLQYTDFSISRKKGEKCST
jgi:hypothetical protein